MCLTAFGTWIDALHVNAGRDDVVRIDLAGLHQMLDLGDGDLAGGRHHRIEVARGLAVDEIAFGIAHIGVHDREIGDQAALHHVALAVEFALVLAFGDQRADAGLGEEGRDAGAAGADALGQRALRIEFDLELVGEILLGEGFVFADIGRDHLLDLPGIEQHAEPLAVDAAIVGDDGEVFDAGIADRQDQCLGNAAQAEAAGHDHHAVLQQPGQRGVRVRIDLIHERSIPSGKISKSRRPIRITRLAQRSTGWRRIGGDDRQRKRRMRDSDSKDENHGEQNAGNDRAGRSGCETQSGCRAMRQRTRTRPSRATKIQFTVDKSIGIFLLLGNAG